MKVQLMNSSPYTITGGDNNGYRIPIAKLTGFRPGDQFNEYKILDGQYKDCLLLIPVNKE